MGVGPQPAPECQASRGACLLAPRCSPAGLGNPHRNHIGRGVHGDRTPGPRLLRAHFLEVLPRRAGSHLRARCLPVARSFPHALLARQLRRSTGKRPAGDSPLARVTGKPREQPRGSAFPGNPLSRRLAERPGAPHLEDPPASRRQGRRLS